MQKILISLPINLDRSPLFMVYRELLGDIPGLDCKGLACDIVACINDHESYQAYCNDIVDMIFEAAIPVDIKDVVYEFRLIITSIKAIQQGLSMDAASVDIRCPDTLILEIV